MVTCVSELLLYDRTSEVRAPIVALVRYKSIETICNLKVLLWIYTKVIDKGSCNGKRGERWYHSFDYLK